MTKRLLLCVFFLALTMLPAVAATKVHPKHAAARSRGAKSVRRRGTAAARRNSARKRRLAKARAAARRHKLAKR